MKPARRAFLCSANEYHLLLRRMNERGMLSFTQQPVCVNGLFGVPKDGDAIRLIIDCRPVNALLVPSPKVALPTPDLIAQFNIAADAPLFAAKVDLDNAYHRIRMPAAWHPYFALPPIHASDIGGIIGYGNDAIVYPCCSTLPMGFSHAVYLAQAAHEYIVDTRVPLLRANDRISHVADRTLDRMRHSIYIDDLNLYGSDVDAMIAAQDQYIAALTSVGLPPKPSKVVRPTANGLECLGMVVNGITGEVGVDVVKLHKLRCETLALLDRGSCTGIELSQFIGRFTWAMLVRRPALALFSSVYKFILISQQRTYHMWPSVRRELHAAAMVVPLLYTSIRSDYMPHVISSDASEDAQGVVASLSIKPPIISSIAALPVVPGVVPSLLSSSVAGANWSTIVSSQWRRSEHINSLELRASLSAIRWSLTSPLSVERRMRGDYRHWCGLLVSDSSATVGSINKGRSSSHRLLRPLRSLNALLLASGVQLHVAWIPSKENPADAPSRRWL